METAIPTGAFQRPESPRAVALIGAAAAQLGLDLEILDPEYGHLFKVTDGQKSVTLLGGRSPLNDAVAARICEDKYYTGLLLGRAGFRVPESVRCLKPGYFQLANYEGRTGKHPGHAMARHHGYPLVVKPNRLSHGRSVQLVYTHSELDRAIDRVWPYDYIALVQTAIPGIDVRLDLLDGQFLVGYTRAPADRDDGRDADAVEILNLAQGASARVLEQPPEHLLEWVREIGRVLQVRYFGVDLKMTSLTSDPKRAAVIEVNASPIFVQLDRLGFGAQARVAQTRVLEAIWNAAK